MKMLPIHIVIALGCFNLVHAQSTYLSSASDFDVFNRQISIEKSTGKNVLHIDTANGAGVAWIKNTNFSSGIIEFDVKGKDVMQQSFVGIAFHGTSDSAYDCIYFRPFNFNATDATRQSHSVQYISLPKYDWSYLREKFPGRYENALNSSINANGWFHAKLVIDVNEIKVFVNNNPLPSLTVQPLHNYISGKIGFWVGNSSDGDFSNLNIRE